MSNVNNKFGCAGVSHKDGYYYAHIKINNTRIMLGKFKLLEDAICKRIMANIKYGLKDKRRLINKKVILEAIEESHEHVKLELTSRSPYWRMCKEQEIERACAVDPNKDYSTINAIIEGLGY